MEHVISALAWVSWEVGLGNFIFLCPRITKKDTVESLMA